MEVLCESCGRMLSRKNMKRHKKLYCEKALQEREKIRHICDTCFKEFKGKIDLLRHCSTHVQDKIEQDMSVTSVTLSILGKIICRDI